MCPITGRELGRFHRFSRPGYWDREAMSMRQRFAPECFNTGTSSVPFPTVIHQMKIWLCKILGIASPAELRPESFLFVTCGNWDVKTAIPLQCNKPVPGTVDFQTQQLMFQRWCNLKDVFREHYRLDPNRAPTGMRGMLNRLKIPLQGQHHLGMDDVSNLAKILTRIVSEGCVIEPTGHATSLPSAGRSGGKGGKKGKGKGKGDGFFGKGDAFMGKGCMKGGKGCFKGDFGGKNGLRSAKGGKAASGAFGKSAPPKEMMRPPQGLGRAPDFVFPRPGMVFGTVPKASAPSAPKAAAEDDDEALGEGEDDYDPFAEEPADAAGKAVDAEEPLAKKRRGLQEFLKGAPVPGEAWDADMDVADLGEDVAGDEDAAAPSFGSLPKPKRAADAGGLAGIFDEPTPSGFCDPTSLGEDGAGAEDEAGAEDAAEPDPANAFLDEDGAEGAGTEASGLSSFFAKLPAPRASA
eukprot:SRR837773.4740.p1 GENE.SRR837773.4740~~SRR837773.4740.p1  ORF type:complete len:539 (+),score=99.05 SRR837773.4740:228-1619(+)